METPQTLLSDLVLQVVRKADVPEDILASLELIIAEQELLYASLCNLVAHWREFGPECGFDETLEAAATRHGI